MIYKIEEIVMVLVLRVVNEMDMLMEEVYFR